MSLKNDLQSILADPQWLPCRWDSDRAAIRFAYLPRASRHKLTFLADEYLEQANAPLATVELSALRAAAIATHRAPHFIFHSAFSASTLLARALDAPGVASALQEPQILNDLADAARQGNLPSGLLRKVVSLLARPFDDEAVVIKLSNVANLSAAAVMDTEPQANAIFLFAPLPRFLRSVSDKGLWGRRWARRLQARLVGDTGIDFGLAPADLFELTDMQVAALAWLMHQAQKLSLVQRFGGRVRLLDSETFLARRAETLASAGAHFGLALDDKQARQLAEGPVFRTHSKELGRAVDPEQPLARHEPVAVIDEEVEMVETWARAMADHARLSLESPPQSALLSSS
jgi:hypothetical protein